MEDFTDGASINELQKPSYVPENILTKPEERKGERIGNVKSHRTCILFRF